MDSANWLFKGTVLAKVRRRFRNDSPELTRQAGGMRYKQISNGPERRDELTKGHINKHFVIVNRTF